MKIDRTQCARRLAPFAVALVLTVGCIQITVKTVVTQPGSGSSGPTLGTGETGPDGTNPSGTFETVLLQTVTSDGDTTVCKQVVSSTIVRFMTNQIPGTLEVKFRGYLSNDVKHALVPNTDYLLQYWVSIANNGCCSNYPASSYDVTCAVTPGARYKFYAHFYPGHLPATGSTFSLYGVFTP